MGLSYASIPIYEKGVIHFTRRLTYSMCSGSGKLIGFADDEEIERVPLT
jgi:hypothetical protein